MVSRPNKSLKYVLHILKICHWVDITGWAIETVSNSLYLRKPSPGLMPYNSRGTYVSVWRHWLYWLYFIKQLDLNWKPENALIFIIGSAGFMVSSCKWRFFGDVFMAVLLSCGIPRVSDSNVNDPIIAAHYENWGKKKINESTRIH